MKYCCGICTLFIGKSVHIGTFFLCPCSFNINLPFNQLVSMIIKLAKLQEAFAVFLEHKSSSTVKRVLQILLRLRRAIFPCCLQPTVFSYFFCLFISYLGPKQYELDFNEVYKYAYNTKPQIRVQIRCACGGLHI